ncbi:hypothetical protein FGO68_gene1518 [Halteria grandinella]|uniref:Uncharacterized protein n=1 Tax=Halteria grandinella TaxID=5974 RepID=A0A8J8T0F6_HALGN|nr:hypothetical protein FGO68_gene1518 [Halteria grandinella]
MRFNRVISYKSKASCTAFSPFIIVFIVCLLTKSAIEFVSGSYQVAFLAFATTITEILPFCSNLALWAWKNEQIR